MPQRFIPGLGGALDRGVQLLDEIGRHRNGRIGGGRCAMAAERIGNSKLLFAAPSGRLPPPAAAPRARRGRRLQRPAVACRSGSQRGGARPGQVVRMREADVSGVPSATTSGRPVGEAGGERSH